MGCHRRFKGRRACAERSIERSKRSECCCRHCKRRHACTERTIERSKRSGPPRKQSKSDFKPAWALNKQAGHRRSTARRSGPKGEHRSGTGCSQKANERSHAGTHRHLGGATARHGDGRSGGTGRRHQSGQRRRAAYSRRRARDAAWADQKDSHSAWHIEALRPKRVRRSRRPWS